jgi:hypothetical protein
VDGSHGFGCHHLAGSLGIEWIAEGQFRISMVSEGTFAQLSIVIGGMASGGSRYQRIANSTVNYSSYGEKMERRGIAFSGAELEWALRILNY